MEILITDTQLYEALREKVGKEQAELIVSKLMVSNIKSRVKIEVESQTKGLATNECVAQLETALVREFNNKLLVYSIATVVATVISLVVLAQYFLQ